MEHCVLYNLLKRHMGNSDDVYKVWNYEMQLTKYVLISNPSQFNLYCPRKCIIKAVTGIYISYKITNGSFVKLKKKKKVK